jgi:hypothetical protein
MSNWVILSNNDQAGFNLITSAVLKARNPYYLEGSLPSPLTATNHNADAYLIIGGQGINPYWLKAGFQTVTQKNAFYLQKGTLFGKTAWGIAGYDAIDTYQGCGYVTSNGLPDSNQIIVWKTDPTPPPPPTPGKVTYARVEIDIIPFTGWNFTKENVARNVQSELDKQNAGWVVDAVEISGDHATIHIHANGTIPLLAIIGILLLVGIVIGFVIWQYKIIVENQTIQQAITSDSDITQAMIKAGFTASDIQNVLQAMANARENVTPSNGGLLGDIMPIAILGIGAMIMMNMDKK